MNYSLVGEILDSKYRIDKQLGSGGMGNVYLATHLGTTRVVAVKVIAPKWAAEPQFLARFQREAQACGRLRHVNIVNVTDFGIARAPRGDMPYLVMEFLDGETLTDFQRSNPNLLLPLIADLLDQIGLALNEAHRQGIVHRDLKPDNIWLEPNGRGGYTVKVLDFGVAKVNLLDGWAMPVSGPPPLPSPLPNPNQDEFETVALERKRERQTAEEVETVAIASTPSPFSSGSFDSGADAKTMPGSLLGTPAYMSPEQALGKEIDFRSDIYSLAVVAYWLVCGEMPFQGSVSDLIEYHQHGSPRAPASLRKIPPDVSAAILAGLARDPADRPPSAMAFARRFHNAVDAEFLMLRRSKAFLMQHLAAFALLMTPMYVAVLSATALLVPLGRMLPAAAVRNVLVPLAAAVFFVFADNLVRAAAALMALDEQVRIRRFLWFRVFWKLMRMLPSLAVTQAHSIFAFGPGWVIGDCLWPVVCVVEKLSGPAAIQRSRELMNGLNSAGRALAVRHFALAALAIADAVKSLGFLWGSGPINNANVTITAVWFPIFAAVAGAPLFLYDRTAASERGPLLQLDRTPEVRINTRMFSISSAVWIAILLVYLLYQPIRYWLFGSR